MSERFACRVLGQHRSTQRKCAVVVEDEAALTAAIVALALQYGRYGYRRITALLRRDGWTINVKRVERIWRREGLKVPARQPKRARLWLNDGSCVRLRPERPDHVWSYDFVEHRTQNGRKWRMLERPVIGVIVWPTELKGSALPTHPAIVTRQTMHERQSLATERGQAR